MSIAENSEYLTSQIITYIGNKRSLLGYIEKEVLLVQKHLQKTKLSCADLFSGSGIVARMLKQYSSFLAANDLENYSCVLNDCYLTNKEDFDSETCKSLLSKIQESACSKKIPGIICKNYAPADDKNILIGERVFYTRENALLIDTYRFLIGEYVPLHLQKFFLAPLLTQASVHVNTSGVFKGFYKDKATGIGCFGAAGKNALSRITGKISLELPVLSNFSCETQIFQKDAVELSSLLPHLDLVYLDPPYNQHPYGSNYFMLNLILKNKIDVEISRVSGITQDWNRSVFNSAKKALVSMEEIIKNLKASFIIISYNSEGFITFEQMTLMLKKYGELKTVEIPYNTFRGSRNLKDRPSYVSEYLFILKKQAG